MSQPFTMYHREYAREGREFDADEPTHPSREELEREGWVSSYKEMGKLGWARNNPKPPEDENLA